MKTAGIVAEYNPYHNGHRYLTEKLRDNGASHIVAVMSGHLVQRGETASFSKWARAEAALQSGVDLVVELPSFYAILSAERFAFAAVSLLEKTGCVDLLGFGSESGELASLRCAADACVSPKADALIRMELSQGVSYAAARQNAVRTFAGEKAAELLSSPNDILGIEYLKALYRLDSAIEPFTVRRFGAGHDAADVEGESASASLIREKIRTNEAICGLVPDEAFTVYERELREGKAPCRMSELETALLFQLRRMTAEEFRLLPDVSEGLELRLVRAAQEARTLEEFYALAKTKRYAHSRLRRIALYAALGATKDDLLIAPPYLRILGMNERGLEVAARMKQTAKLPYGTSLAKLAVDADSRRIAALEQCAGNLFALGVPNRLSGSIDYTTEAVIIKK